MAQKATTIICTFILTIGGAFPFAFASSVLPSFTAVCDDKNTHSFRSGIDLLGKMLPDNWSAEYDEFPGPIWETFKYMQGQNFLLLERANKRLPITAYHDGGMVVVDVAATADAVSVWTYAINVKIKRIVASQVNSFAALGTGVKGRVVELECAFQF